MSYRWCPQGGVGTRRWSKFAKYLSRQGVTTEVVCADYPFRDRVNWCADVSGNDRIVRYPTPAGYPDYLRQPRRGILVKIGSRVLQRTTHPIDTAQGWGRHFVRQCRQRLDSGTPFDAVILTVPSFSALMPFAELAADYPGVRFIVDYRDPWTYFFPDYGRTESPERERYTALEGEALSRVDEVWFTTEEHRRDYSRRFPESDLKFRVLPNGYDPEDFPDATRLRRGNMIAVCPGTLIRERMETLANLLRGLVQVDDPVLNQHFRIHLYTNERPALDDYEPGVREAYARFVRLHDVVSPPAMARILAESRFGLVLHDANYTQTVPIKLYDFLAAGCEVIYLGPPTEVSRLLEEKGHFCATDAVDTMVPLLHRLAARHPRTAAPANEFPQYAIPELTERLLLLLTRQ
ncbi:glycosyltransferase involved in cell wall biosynthesis [Lewinella marina]|uniref:glycosyltransferase n=1 Tax=Neolewinella marina TaxID=438751 RepID=UPI001430D351|nr:glycosyltransferase [Neolewinella marina]NJB86651.1 glycosyltransferase involved in cell wall biosynthesis [Neolewinella marina]